MSTPLLLSPPHIQQTDAWRPTRYLDPPRPPPVDPTFAREQEIAQQRLNAEGRAVRKVKPRRTVDFNGELAKMRLLKKIRPSAGYVPLLRPAPPFVIDLLPPKAYADNPTTSVCTKFVHTSTNKVRCPVNVVAWTPEGRRLLTGSQSGEFTLWNGLTFNFETILQAHDTAVRAFSWSHSGAYLISSDTNGNIKYFQSNMNNLAVWQGHREAVRGVSFSPDDSRFATGADDSVIKLWSFEEMREERVLAGHGWDVKCVDWHPVKGLIVSGSKDNSVKFWDPRTATCLSTLHQHKNTVQSCLWNPSGDFVATASRDQTIRVFDIRVMKEIQIFKGHKKEVCSLAWHPIHHEMLASGGSEGSIYHWLVESPNPIAQLDEAHDSNVWTLAWHPLGHVLCSGSNDHTTRFWCRDRPGEETTVMGEKPPVAGQESTEEQDDFVPGFNYQQGGGMAAQNGGFDQDGQGGAYGGGQAPWTNGAANGADDFIPGLGGRTEGAMDGVKPERAPLPSQEEANPDFGARDGGYGGRGAYGRDGGYGGRDGHRDGGYRGRDGGYGGQDQGHREGRGRGRGRGRQSRWN
ncbi:WD40 repeat-like protein [Calocera viscosa TUFC12733]|uniref:Polyadenylation factor subunit 2 n=1 Tax=Calocera viscosa (strain TUFC12733) TaxID=1330018 RepID=A0A167KZW4_CALVF|nr:WD40 repeat-like protein [Calocera viscosa TUFC12733]